MKIFLLSLFVVAAFAAPAPLDEEIGEPVELVVNGIEEGEPLEIGDVLGIKVKHHADGVMLSSTDLLHPLTAAGIEEAAGAENPDSVEVVEQPEPEPDSVEVVDVPENVEIDPDSVEVVDVPENIEIVPEPVELPPPVIPEIVPIPPVNEPAIIPEDIYIPAVPEIPESPVVPENPESPVVPENPESPVIPDAVPDPIYPEANPPVEPVPEPAPERPAGEVFYNGLVQVKVHGEPGVLETMQSWFNMVLNYFNGNDVASQQIV